MMKTLRRLRGMWFGVFAAVIGFAGWIVAQPLGSKYEYQEVRLDSIEVGAAHEVPLANPDGWLGERPTIAVRRIDGKLVLEVQHLHNYLIAGEEQTSAWLGKTADDLVEGFKAAGLAILPIEKFGQYEIGNRANPLRVLLYGEGIVEASLGPEGETDRLRLVLKMIRRAQG